MFEKYSHLLWTYRSGFLSTVNTFICRGLTWLKHKNYRTSTVLFTVSTKNLFNRFIVYLTFMHLFQHPYCGSLCKNKFSNVADQQNNKLLPLLAADRLIISPA